MTSHGARSTGRHSDAIPRSGVRRPQGNEFAILTLTGSAAVIAAACIPVAGIEDGPILCPFRLLTGLPCPGCGLTRSFVYSMHRHFGEALSAHAFGPALVLLIVLAAVTRGVRAVRRQPPIDMGRVVRHPFAIVMIVGWLAYAVARAVSAVG